MKSSLAVVVIVVVLLVGLVSGYYGASFSRPQAGAGTATVNVQPTAPAAKPVPPAVYLTMVSEGHEGGSLGADNKTHDTIMPSNLTIYVGQTVYLTIINYDEGPHTITSTSLGINFNFPGAIGDGKPSVSHFQFKADKAGVYRWWCALPCDNAAGQWAMGVDPKDGQPGRIGFMGGFISVVSA